MKININTQPYFAHASTSKELQLVELFIFGDANVTMNCYIDISFPKSPSCYWKVLGAHDIMVKMLLMLWYILAI